MPEENFEQQARNMAERFSMEPKADVWQRVQAAITPPKRKRRALLWWWLLPLLIAGGGAVIVVKNNYPNHKTNTLSHNANTIKRQEKNIATNQKKPIIKKEKRSKKENESLFSASKKKPQNNISNKKIFIKKIEAGEIKDIAQAEQKTKLSIHSADDEKQENAMFPNSSIPNIKRDSITDRSHTQVTITSDNIDTSSNDVVKTNAEIIVKSKDSLQKSDSSTIRVQIKNKKVKSYRIGLLAEIGTASWGGNLLGNQNGGESFAKSITNNSSSDFNNADIKVHYRAKKGIDAAFGIAVQKSISHKFYVAGKLSYRYQQIAFTQTTTIDTLSINPVNNSFSIISFVYYKINQTDRLHFANVYAGIGWQFFNRKNIILSVQTGFDNSILLASDKKINGQLPQNNLFDNLTTYDFYKWQPHVNGLVSVDVTTRQKIHLQFAPFVRFGFRKFQNNDIDYKTNHLSSAGLQAIYFFK